MVFDHEVCHELTLVSRTWKKEVHPSTLTTIFDGIFAHQHPPSCRHGWPLSRPVAHLRTRPLIILKCGTGFLKSEGLVISPEVTPGVETTKQKDLAPFKSHLRESAHVG
jgi:hypothetical protein